VTAAAIASFEESLSAQDVPVTRTTAAEATGELASFAASPAVGVPLPLDGVSLPADVAADPSPSELDAATTGITPAGPAVADYGSVVVADEGTGAEHVSLFAETHVAVVAASDVVQTMSDALDELGPRTRDGLTSAVVATGPSATADMGELVLGAHGPTAVRVVLVTDR
jgi:L-lactate dehydrogenase complex protein LldG